MISLSSVGLKNKQKNILSDISFDLGSGELVAIIGASGAGKSSLFKILIGEKRPTTGSIEVNGIALENISAYELQKYRQQIGVVFQDFKLLENRTVQENIEYALDVCGKKDRADVIVPAVLKAVGLENKQHALPHTLSGGEQQRVSIARALIHEPKILIADEPTGNLDPKNTQEIATLFRLLHEKLGMTIVFSTHNPEFITYVKPRVIRLEAGKLLFDKKNCTKKEAFIGIASF
jgi:cell division transport system ATP-binding protein